MAEFINLTPHTINIRVGDTPEIVLPPNKGGSARVTEVDSPGGGVFGVPYVRKEYGDVVMPEVTDPDQYGEPVLFIVSALVLAAIKAEKCPGEYTPSSFFAPNTSPSAIRENGQIKAVVQLVGI